VQDAAVAPHDEDIQAALCLQMKILLAEDAVLAGEGARLWLEAQRAGATVIAAGERSVAIGRDFTDNTIITGEQNVVKP
jgi:hypothetical protein